MALSQPSPFPGMDPYLETVWRGVHLQLIAFMAEALQPALPRELRARGEAELHLSVPPEGAGSNLVAVRYPDVTISEHKTRTPVADGADGSTALLVPATAVEPIIVDVDVEPWYERWVKIIDSSDGGRLVTAIEILSPWNKRAGTLNRKYRRKVERYQESGANVVEVDLIRGSRQRLAVPAECLPKSRRTAYYTAVSRAGITDRWEVYPMSLRAALPSVPIPLRAGDADVWLDLQPLVSRVYLAGAYDSLDYSRPADPPLTGDDDAWADALLRAAGLRAA